jgi:hypothetical protein
MAEPVGWQATDWTTGVRFPAHTGIFLCGKICRRRMRSCQYIVHAGLVAPHG